MAAKNVRESSAPEKNTQQSRRRCTQFHFYTSPSHNNDNSMRAKHASTSTL